MTRDLPVEIPTPAEPFGVSPGFRRVIERAKQVARCFILVVLILGEPGTGKDEIARYIHAASQPHGDFLPINCGAFQDTTVEAELFGNVAGAFTDARWAKPGLAETVGRGTLFFDEVGDMSPAMQVKVLRFVQFLEFRRVGGVENMKARCHVIAATNQNLVEKVQEGTFRKDLFDRLCEFPIVIPPLRERKEDILPLAAGLTERIRQTWNLPPVEYDEAVLVWMVKQEWRGNARELESFIKRMIVLSERRRITMGVVEDAASMTMELARYSAPAPMTVVPIVPATVIPVESLDVRDRILAVVLPGQDVRESKIWEATGLTREAGRRTLLKLVETGVLEKADRGAYRRRASRGA